MKHVVNLALVGLFAALAVTGALAYALPFSSINTRLHLITGAAFVALVLAHLAVRTKYFSQAIRGRINSLSRRQIALALGGAASIIATGLLGWGPALWLMQQSYESRHSRQIVRASSLAGFDNPNDHSTLVMRSTESPLAADLSVLMQMHRDLPQQPAIALWTESANGTMIETLYVSAELAYSDAPKWNNQQVSRGDILPIWRHKYSQISGINADGSLDTQSGATAKHTYALDPYLELGQDNSFVVCVEINAAADANADWTDPQLGQPSLLYTALVEVDRESPHALLELTGHGGSSTDDQPGHISYDVHSITTAKQIVDLLLVKVER